MKGFSLNIPTKIYFGEDILYKALHDEKELLYGNIMIVTGKQAMKKLGYLDILINILERIGIVNDVVIFDGISSNPKSEEINLAIQYGVKSSVKTIIGFGGGSSIDAAKAIALGVSVNDIIEPYVLGTKDIPKEILPVIAIPTTAGTGTELSKAAIITCTGEMLKRGIRGSALYPKVAIVDSTFTLKLPTQITKESGFDVFAHAVESYISLNSNCFTEALSIETIKIVCNSLPKLLSDHGNNSNVCRLNMSYSSMIMGINLGNVGTCLPHRMQYPIGALNDTSHGLGLAAIYREWFSFGYRYSKAKFDHIGLLISGKKCSNEQELIDIFDMFMQKIHMNNVTLKTLGITIKDLQLLSSNVDGNIYSDPVSAEEDIINKIYKASM